METRFGELTVTYSARGIPTFSVEAFHDGLHKHALVRAAFREVLANKSQAVALQWNEAWNKQVAAERFRSDIENRKSQALERTLEDREVIDSLKSTLVRGIELDPTFDWEELKNKAPFPKKTPPEPLVPTQPTPRDPPSEPERSLYKYPKLSILDRVIPSRKAARLAELARQFDLDVRSWKTQCSELAAQHQNALAAHLELRTKLEKEHAMAMLEWNLEKARYLEDQTRQNQEVCERVLSRSEYPACIPREFDFEFNRGTGMLLMNSRLPAPDDLPKRAEVKYVQTTNTFKEIFLSEAQSA